ncbi:MAG: glycine cleavage system aminomethyltransferase GcvT [Synergistaceae bacterium]|jgi:aminomethyltransferase|nr:glycine cleavage system aminomethyltransferase GcvT [Synergistaceae bacterium]
MKEGGELRRTPLYGCHAELGGRIVPFAGYELPVQYSGVIAEHMAVRTRAGLFDVSHMGEVIFSGPDALANIQLLLTNDFTDMVDGRVRYSLMCNDEGGVIDDLIVYRNGRDRYLTVVNASNREKDVAWMKSHSFGDVKVEDISDDVAQIALQGPASEDILQRVAEASIIPAGYYTFKDGVLVGGVKCLLSRTGYTGELGFELYMANRDAPKLWHTLLDAGSDLGLIPAGLGARDTLRLEASMPLYGHEMDETVTPFQAGLSFAVKMAKENFIGKSALQSLAKPVKSRVGLKVAGRGIVREREIVYIGDRAVGVTTSGTHCPFLGAAFAMASVDSGIAVPGAVVEADVRGRRIEAEIVPLPFYKRAK